MDRQNKIVLFLKNNLKFLLLFVIAISTILFQQEEITTYKEKLSITEESVKERDLKIFKLTTKLETNEQKKNLNVIEYYENGQIKKVNKTVISKTSSSESKNLEDAKEKTKLVVKKELKKEIYEKTHKNPKKLWIGIGVRSDRLKDPYLDVSYKLYPFLKGELNIYMNEVRGSISTGWSF